MLLLALQARGYAIVGDSPRTIIQDRRRRGLNPRPNAFEFAHEVLRMDIENFVHWKLASFCRETPEKGHKYGC